MKELENAAQRRFGTIVAGKWTLERLLGVGAMGAVYEGRHHNGHRVAIKVLHAHHVHHRTLVSRLQREARLANLVDHPSVVHVLDDGTTDDGAPFLVSELLVGETLEHARVAAGGSLPLPEVQRLGRELLDVLEVAHARGVLHRDIKPANLFIVESGELRVLDFGLGCASDGGTVGGEDAPLTSVDTVLGTVGFMAPEQASGRWDLVDERTDLWAAGATLLKLATGHDAHEATTVQEQLAFAATRPAPHVRVRAPSLPAPFASALDRAMAFSKRDRFPSARAMREALEGGEDAARPAMVISGAAPEPKPARSWFVPAGGLAIVAACVVAFSAAQKTPPPAPAAVVPEAAAESSHSAAPLDVAAVAAPPVTPVPSALPSASARSTELARRPRPSGAPSASDPQPPPVPSSTAVPAAAPTHAPASSVDPMDRRR